MAQLNTYRVARAGTQFGKHKSKVTLADTHGARFVRSGDLELLEENVIAEDAPARPAADAAALKDQIASLTARASAPYHCTIRSRQFIQKGISGSTIQNSARCLVVLLFSARNVGPKV